MSFRALALVVHRWVGLAITVFLVVAGLTGSLISFYHELDLALNPALLRARSPMAGAELLDPLLLRERLQAQLPADRGVRYVALELEHGRAARFYVDLPPAREGAIDDEYFVDPYSGELIGSRRSGDLAQGIENLMPFILRLHYSLALGEIGTTLFGIVALLWTLDCFVGAYLTLPARSQTGKATARKPWLARWKPAWLLRATKLFSLVFTWHRASGLWVWSLLLVFAWSSVGLNLREQVYDPVMKLAFGMHERAQSQLPILATPRHIPALSWYAAREASRAAMADRAALDGFELIHERSLGYYPELGVYRYRVRSSRDVSDRYAGTTVWVDGDTGRALAFDFPTGQSVGDTLSTWLYQLHFGAVAIGGLPYRFFVCLMGLLVALLSITGAWIWWKKRDKRRS
jgi:uncharacterized iron-regulated membrane protein